MWKNFSGICGEKKPTIVEEFFRKFGEDVLGSLMFRQYLMMDTYFCVADYVESLREGEKEKVEKIDLSRMALQSVEQAAEDTVAAPPEGGHEPLDGQEK